MREIEINDEEFNGITGRRMGLVLVEFWAEWCGPCKGQKALLSELCKDREMTLATVNVDKEPNLALRLSIGAVPTLMFYNNGKLKKTLFGAQPKQKLLDTLEAAGKED